MIDRVLGDGHCGRDGCTQTTGENQLLCRKHWFKVPPALRADVVNQWRRYRMNQITLGELRAVQSAAIKAAQ